jgi:uroporphyrinogen decarboxylase
MGFTHEARQKLAAHYGAEGLDAVLQDHVLGVGGAPMAELADKRVRDEFGVVWNRSVDEDIGVVEHYLLPQAMLAGCRFPDPTSPAVFDGIARSIAANPERFRVFNIGFSLYERAWTLRGMENLMADFCLNPAFAHDLLEAIGDFNVARVRAAVACDIDAVYFGDDWGTQQGLQMGYPLWREFIYPVLQRMYAEVRKAGKYVFIHSCGKVDELFDDLIGIGLGCFNPFQPEVMDVAALMTRYHGRLAFHGGLSTQRTLPQGSTDDVRRETRKLLELGRKGGYIFAPAHAVEGDVPVENLVAMIEEVTGQG